MASKKDSLSPLPVYPEISIALHLLTTVPPRFHWTLFVQAPNSLDGYKFHAMEKYVYNKEQGTTEKFWEYERVKFTLAKSQSVATAVVIGTIPSSKTADDLHVILQAIPVPIVPEIDREREPNFNCRVWIREAVRRMNIMGYIQCPDVDALEAEIIGYGKEAAEAVEAETFIIAKLRTASKSR